jgi:hypothetical protein
MKLFLTFDSIADFAEKGLEEVEPSTSSGVPVKVEERALRVWNIEYYSFLFNVDTTEVGLRMLRSIVPFSFRFFQSVENNPDLYVVPIFILSWQPSCCLLFLRLALYS